MLDASGKPLAPYREFTNHTKSQSVLADRLRAAFDDLYLTDKNAHDKTSEELKGWFKSKTGAGDAVATKMARTRPELRMYKGELGIPSRSSTSELRARTLPSWHEKFLRLNEETLRKSTSHILFTI